MTWFKDVFNSEKAIIASMYLPSLPGSPNYKPGTTMEEIIEFTRRELWNLQEGGMDGVSIGNQQNWPYKVGVGPETSSLMTRAIIEATRNLKIAFGISVFWDDLAGIAIAKATGAKFVRGVFRGVYAGEMGMLSLNAADALRYRKEIDAEDIKLMFMLRPILGKSIADRGLLAEVKDAVWGSKPDSFTLCGPIPGEAPTIEELKMVSEHSKGCPVVMNNGANPSNICEVLSVCNGAVVATHLRKDKKSSNPFDKDKVRAFMDIVNKCR